MKPSLHTFFAHKQTRRQTHVLTLTSLRSMGNNSLSVYRMITCIFVLPTKNNFCTIVENFTKKNDAQANNCRSFEIHNFFLLIEPKRVYDK